ncbi:uncharacterized protein LOC141651289 [Silene latifolia]|uniref:uncharacterized protein LOC141651289 n=1 Tax=Silene latifolia TaxID=37657 RepID=UPI003D7727CF
MPTPVLNWKTPHELLFGTVPIFDELRVFGCQCYATVPITLKDKFAPRKKSLPLVTDVSLADLLLAESNINKERQTPIQSDFTHTDNLISIPQSGQHGSSKPICSAAPSATQSDTPTTFGTDQTQLHSELNARKSDRIRKPSVLLSDYEVSLPKASALHVRVINELNMFDKHYLLSLCNVVAQLEPSSYKQALTDANWITAMKAEI